MAQTALQVTKATTKHLSCCTDIDHGLFSLITFVFILHQRYLDKRNKNCNKTGSSIKNRQKCVIQFYPENK